jgi:hypothetical protein
VLDRTEEVSDWMNRRSSRGGWMPDGTYLLDCSSVLYPPPELPTDAMEQLRLLVADMGEAERTRFVAKFIEDYFAQQPLSEAVSTGRRR